MVSGATLRLIFGLIWMIALPSVAFAAGDASYESVRNNQSYSAQGEKTCLTCHNSHPVDLLLQTPHAVKGDLRTPFGQEGCEACHGPSADHATLKMVDGKMILPPVLFKKPAIEGADISSVADRNKACLGCHQSGMTMNWQGSQHDRSDIACTNCHIVHAAKDPVLVKTSQPEICFSCHAQQRAQSLEYSHHPIREGKVACSDCHNPMGSPGPHLLKEFSVNETCYQCHGEKRGPMLWEHQPVREDCTNCHTPHGSNQARLMKEPLNFLCASCHSAEANQSGGAFGGAHSVAFGSSKGSPFSNSALGNQRQCVNCHSQVHGSNSPSGTFFFR